MEVKIKNNGEMLEATIEMVDGVMVVSPKVEKFEPENGDIVTTMGGEHIFLCKDYIGEGDIYAYLGYDFNLCSWFKKGEWSVDRYATEEEKKKLFDRLAEEGWEFDFDKKELVKLKWKPKKEDRYFAPWIREEDGVHFFIDTLAWEDDSIDKELYEKGWVFKTEEECKAFVEKLNKTIESVKP